MQLVRQKATLRLHQVHHRFKDMTWILSSVSDSHEFCTGSPAPFAGWNSDPGWWPHCNSGAQLSGGYSSLWTCKSLTLFSNVHSQVCWGLGHWVCVNSQPVILHICAPPLYNKLLTQWIPFRVCVLLGQCFNVIIHVISEYHQL